VSRYARVAYHLSRLVLGGLFLYAGLVKAGDVTAFARDVANYRILPYSWNYLVAATLPYIEFLAGLLLVVNRRVRPAALVTGGLTVVFMAFLASVVARGLDIDCGCFRSGGHTSAAQALWRDAGILLLSIVTYRLRGRPAP
jgi:uncharacterized membrane protein YphA (DoxX/SURF4 family)